MSFDQGGLSMDQAPPLSVVLRFFFSGAAFGLGAGFYAMLHQQQILRPHTIEGQVFTHLLTLGVMMSFMFGALFQMLPVLAGVRLPSPKGLATWVQLLFVPGTLVLLMAFRWGYPWLFSLAAVLLAAGILPVAWVSLNRLRAAAPSPSSRGMIFALLALTLVIMLALYLSLSRAGWLAGDHYALAKQAHYSWGTLGWITLLVVSISFQVIEMFYVTPPHPPWMRRWLTLAVVCILVTATCLSPLLHLAWSVAYLLLAMLLIVYAAITLRRLQQKKRPLSDASVWLWRLGLASLIASLVTTAARPLFDSAVLGMLSSVLFASFAVSVVFAMTYKIVPFLTWFHLSREGYFSAPMMHEIVRPQHAKRHLGLHIANVALFVFAVFIPEVTPVAGAMMAVSFGWMGWVIARAYWLYLHTHRTQEKIDLGLPMGPL